MALTYMEELKKKQQGQTAQPAQGGLSGVSENTQAQLQKYQNGYQPTQQATSAQNNLQTLQGQKPQGYNSKYGAQLDSILQSIQNPGTFKYDMNGDTLFQSYKDLFAQQAKQGAINAQGTAAALTGGYGNSYGLSAGAQAYQQALLPLYERIPEFAQLARQNYDADISNQYRALGALQDADQTGYNRYRDEVEDYNADVDRAREDARYEDETGYNRYMDQLKYWQGLAEAENADMRATQDEDFRKAQLAEQIRGTDLDEQYRRDTLAEEIRQNDQDNDYRNRTLDWNISTDARDYEAQQKWNEENNKLDWANLEEKQRQFDADLSEEQRQYNQKVAIAYVTDILANGQMPSMEMLVAAGLSYEDAQKLMAQIQTGGGPGPRTTTEDDGGTTQKPMSFLEANQYIFRNTPDNLTLGDLGATANAGMTVGDYKKKLEEAIAARDEKNTPTTEDKIKNASWTGAAGALAAKQEAVKQQPTKMDYIEWLKKQSAGKVSNP